MQEIESILKEIGAKNGLEIALDENGAYPLPLADATPESVETIFNRFVELQSAWAERFAEMVADAQDEDDGADDKDGEEGEGAKADLIINP